MSLYRHFLAIPLVLIFALFPYCAKSSPWIEPGDEQLRHHIQVLADTGILRAPITTWPLPWASIASDLEQATTAELTEAQRWSLAYVKFYLQQAKNKVNLHAYAGSNSDPVVLRDFGSEQREENEVKASADWVGERFAGRLSLTWAPDATDSKDIRLDGSYLGAQLGNWAITAGALDRWWGPSWQSNLILSNNARPVPSISISRQNAEAFETPWLSWIGPWTFTIFAGQLESERAIPNAKLLGARLAFRPVNSFEMGFSRTAQWGGNGRPQSWSSLWDLVLGNDNVGDGGIDPDNEPGNQIGAIDIRWSLPIESFPVAVYWQYAGEDESNGFPSRGTDLVGLDTAFMTGSVFTRLVAEYADTMAGAHLEKRPNYTYEHNIYESGYRYFGRALGSTFDNDSRVVSFAVDHYFVNGNQLSWKLMKLALNRDGSDVDRSLGGSPFNAEQTAIYSEISYSHVFKRIKVTTSVYNVDQEIQWNAQSIEGTGVGLALEYKPN